MSIMSTTLQLGNSSTATKIRRRANTAVLGPLHIPVLHSPTRDVIRRTPEEEFGEEVQLVGFGISKAQTNIISPTTPAAIKSAALHPANPWGYFDQHDGEDDEIRDSLYEPFHPQSQPDTPEQEITPEEKPVPTPQKLLPSPWSIEKQSVQGPQRNRSRASSAAALLGDLNIKRFIPGLGSSKTTPRAQDAEPITRSSRSGSILGKLNGLSLRQSSRDPSPRRGHRRMISSPMATDSLLSTPSDPLTAQEHRRLSPSPVTSLHPSRASSPSGRRRVISSPMLPDSEPSSTPLPSREFAPVEHQIQRLKRSTSHDSIPFSALSRQSTLDNYEKFAHIESQVNTRAKAVRDMITDNLPSIATLNFAALRPEFSLPALPKSISTVFLPGKREELTAPSPTKGTFTNPRYPFLEEAMENMTGDLVVLGGYRGSTLRSAEPPHRQLWAPIKIGLNMRQVDLEVGLNAEDEESMEERIFPSGMLTNVGPIDISKRLLTRLRKCPNAKRGDLRVHDWGYDWRLSPALLTQKLISYLESLPANQPGSSARGVTIVAHSLGGLITRKAVNDRPDLFAGVVYAGTPQFCVNILGPFRNGDDVLLSSKILTAQVNFTLRTSFALLPESGQCFIDIDEPQQQYHVDFFDIEAWKKYAFSPCIAKVQPALYLEKRKSIFGVIPTFNNGRTSPSEKLESKAKDLTHPVENTLEPSMSPPAPAATTSTIPLPDAISYLERTLQETLTFKKSLHHIKSHQDSNLYPPMAVLYSTSLPTVYGAKVAGRDGIARADAYDNLAFASGDGVVLARAAMLPRGYKTAPGGRVRTARAHVGMLGDLDAVGKCLLAVVRSRRDGVGLGEEFKADDVVQDRITTGGDGIGDGRPF